MKHVAILLAQIIGGIAWVFGVAFTYLKLGLVWAIVAGIFPPLGLVVMALWVIERVA